MIFVDRDELEALLRPRELVEALRSKFRSDCEMPMRHHHQVKNHDGPDGTLLLMPAWQPGGFLGMKCVTVFPGNFAAGLPTLMGFYALMSARTGELLALMDARVLTAKRTGAASALAAEYLAREDAKHLLIVGTGALAPYMVRAHAAVRPIERVTVFGRSPAKVESMVEGLRGQPFEIVRADNLEQATKSADIVCCATTATAPLIRGAWLKPGTHVDLVGAFKPDMREADEEAVTRSSVYVDSRAGAMHEAGDILVPLKRGTIGEDHVRADLFELSRGVKTGRGSPAEITLFKSVGMALEDLAAAELVFSKRAGEVATVSC